MNRSSSSSLMGLYALPAVGCLFFILYQLRPVEGMIGHDYYLAFAEMLFGQFHFRIEGFSVPHFNPWQCGGIPFFADPQSTYYSLPQWLNFLFSPWMAVILSYALFMAFGYLGTYLLFSRVFLYGFLSSHLTALLFLLNGFAFAHFWVGHLTHHGFFLFPWILLFWLSPKGGGLRPILISSLGTALCGAYLLWSGGAHLLVVFAFLALLLLPYACKRHRADRPAHLYFLSFSLGLFFVFCWAKLSVALAYLPLGHRHAMSLTPESPVIAFLRYFWFWPSTPPYLPFGTINQGAWEYVGFISKACLPLSLGAMAWWWKGRENNRSAWLFYYALAFAGMLALASGKLVNLFPLLTAYHNPIKLFIVLLWPILFLCAFVLNALERSSLFKALPPSTRTVCFFFLAALLYTEYSYSIRFFRDNALGISFSPSAANQIDRSLKLGEPLPPVAHVIAEPGKDIQVLAQGETSLACYEPLFGYRQEEVRAQIRPGPTEEIVNGVFNLNHPGCFLYPDHFQCRAWDRIPQTEENAFLTFRQGRNPWEIPLWHRLALILSFVSLTLGMGVFLFAHRNTIKAECLRLLGKGKDR